MATVRPLIILFIVIAAILSAGCITQPAAERNASLTATQVTAASPMSMSVPFGPIPVPSRDGQNIAYELELVPAGNVTLVPEQVDVLDKATGAVLFCANGTLFAALYHPAAIPPPTAEELRNGTGKLSHPRISVWFTVDQGAVPDRLVHRVTLNRTADGQAPITVTGGEVAVRKDQAPVVIGSPMRGPGWVAMETTSAFTHHFGAQITLGGVTRVPQRYAQDWIYVDPATGQVASGNVSLAKNYYGYGKELHAVADGTVVAVEDGLPDVETIYSAQAATFATAAGNFAIIDIGNGKYACYAHMIPGSLRVKAGAAVREGQVIGQMGNSGNSDLPHLHFQVVTDTPSFLGAEGFPHVYRSFDVTGAVNETLAQEKSILPGATITDVWREFGDVVTFFDRPTTEANSLPENWDIVRLP